VGFATGTLGSKQPCDLLRLPHCRSMLRSSEFALKLISLLLLGFITHAQPVPHLERTSLSTSNKHGFSNILLRIWESTQNIAFRISLALKLFESCNSCISSKTLLSVQKRYVYPIYYVKHSLFPGLVHTAHCSGLLRL